VKQESGASGLRWHKVINYSTALHHCTIISLWCLIAMPVRVGMHTSMDT
jgi:hypothetical protein